jgi:excisionase family DNA binding protein
MSARDKPAGQDSNAVRGSVSPSKKSSGTLKFFTIDEVTEMLSVSARTVRRWIDRGELVAHHFGAAVRISDADLRAFLALRREG